MSVGAQVGNLSWKMCSHCWGHEKSTMLNQALGPAPIFSKIAFYTPIRVQVGSLSEKCVLLAMTIQNQQCSFRPLSLPQLFQNGPWHVCWGSSSEPELENVLPLPSCEKSTMLKQAFGADPNFSKMSLLPKLVAMWGCLIASTLVEMSGRINLEGRSSDHQNSFKPSQTMPELLPGGGKE